jgi:hypothetical protein
MKIVPQIDSKAGLFAGGIIYRELNFTGRKRQIEKLFRDQN